MFLLQAGWWKKFLYKERNDMYRKYYQCANRRHKSSKNSAGKRFTFYKWIWIQPRLLSSLIFLIQQSNKNAQKHTKKSENIEIPCSYGSLSLFDAFY